VYFPCMAFKTLTISAEAHARLKKLKGPGDSFTDVILRELPEPCDTAGEVLDWLSRIEVPKANPKLRAAVLAGRGRRSNRRAAR
jgi:predicted CopG family antitoxin